MAHQIERFCKVAFWEGTSFLVLLLVAMPLKYWFAFPQAVRFTGMAHGALFVLYLLLLGGLLPEWGVKRTAVAFLAALVPGGTYWLEARLRREAAAAVPAELA